MTTTHKLHDIRFRVLFDVIESVSVWEIRENNSSGERYIVAEA